MKKSPRERRLYPRIAHALPVNIIANGYDFVTTTQNISCLGAYCHINKYVPPFTKIAVKLSLPIVEKKKRKECPVECNGVIVRSLDDSAGGFNIAVFFNEIKEKQRRVISKYISQFVPQDNSCLG